MNPAFKPRDDDRDGSDGHDHDSQDERDERAREAPGRTIGKTGHDWLSLQMGTDVCRECRRRRTPWEIRVCEGGCGE